MPTTRWMVGLTPTIIATSLAIEENDLQRASALLLLAEVEAA